MKAGWTTKPLGELCDILDSRRKPVTKSDRIAGPYPYYGATGIQDFVNDFLFDEPLVLVGEDGAKWESGENTAFPIEGKCWVNNHAHVLRPIRERLLDNWLIHFLNHSDLTEYVSGLTVPKLNQGSLREIRIPLAPIEEQRRIVTLLDEVFADIATAKANAEKNLQNARTLFISHLQSGYHQQGEGWTPARIADIAKHSLGKMLDKAKNRGDLKPYLRNLNVRWFDFDLSDVQEMKFTPEESGKYTAIKGDVLICEGGYPGRCAIWEDDEPIYFQKALHRVRFNNPLHSKWFVNYLYLMDQTGDLKNHFSGTGIQHFTGEALAKFTLPIPPDKQIQQVLGKANQLEAEVVRLESIYRQKLTALDDLKKTLMHQAFSGQL